MKLLSSFLILALVGTSGAHDALLKFDNFIQVWNISAAEKFLQEMKGAEDVKQMLQGVLAYYSGNYTDAVHLLRSVKSDLLSLYPRAKDALYYAENMTSITQGFRTIQTDHFSIRFSPGQDLPFAIYAGDVLEASYRALNKVMGFSVNHKIPVEIMPDIQSFALASPLKEIEIRRTGTVALCKYAKVFLTSPWMYSRGYHWATTVNHELVHYAQKVLFGDTIPLWLNEGVAKHYENLWRGEMGLEIYKDTATLSTLKKAIEKGKWISFDEMYPSIAKLPKAEDASIAFAEVNHFTEWVERKFGSGALLNLLSALATYGGNEEKAFIEVFGKSRDQVIGTWKRDLEEEVRGVKEIDVPLHPSLKKRRSSRDVEENELNGSPVPDKYSRLGDLLMRSGYFFAAGLEFEKSLKESGKSVMLLNRTGLAFAKAEKYDLAVKYFKKAHNLYPFLFTTNYRLGLAYARNGRCTEALQYLKEALYINPFHPDLHSHMKICYEKTGQMNLARREEEVINFLLKFLKQ